MKAIAFLFLATFTLPAFAGSVREDIQRLSREIRQIAPNSDASDENLQEALNRLIEARDLLGGSSDDGSSGRQSCVDFAYKAYSVTYGQSATAANFAAEACKKVKDRRVLEVLYDAYSVTYGQGATAINFAAAAAAEGVDGKGQLLAVLYDAYKVTYGAGATAINFSIEGAKKLKRNATSCVSDLYPRYATTYGKGATAINFAIEKCQ